MGSKRKANSDRALHITVLPALLVLVASAGLLYLLPSIMAGKPAPAPSDVQWMMPEVTRGGGVRTDRSGPVVVSTNVGSSVRLDCGVYKLVKRATDGWVVFNDAPRRDCTVQIAEAKPFGPVFPGDRVHCAVRTGETRCEGGWAHQHTARVKVEADLPGYLEVDGERLGVLPMANVRLAVGTHDVRVVLTNEAYLQWPLTVSSDERVNVRFPAPEWIDVASLPPLPPPLVPVRTEPEMRVALSAEPSGVDTDAVSHSEDGAEMARFVPKTRPSWECRSRSECM